MQKNIHLMLLCMFFVITAFGNEEPKTKRIKPLYLQNNEFFHERHDGKHFFIAQKISIAQPTQTDIELAIADAQTQGRIIKITSSSFSIPAVLKEVTSLPVTFRNQIDGWNYDITVFAMTFTPSGSKLSIGCKFNLPNNQSIYFGANDIAVSGKNGFVGELPILESSLTDAKQAEMDDANGVLGGETKFFEFPIANFNNKLTMGLGKDTKLHFECGTFKKFTLSGYLKSFGIVERENNDGTIINDGKPLLLFFGTKDVFDWQDMYFEASVSRSFHHPNLKELGFNFSTSNKAIIDLSKVQNPANLPTCVNVDDWQGVYFPTFQVRLPQFFKLRDGVTLVSRTGKNLFIDKTGLLGNMTAEKVYELNEGYTDNVNQFDMSLDLLSANFVCNQAPMVSMLGRIQLGKCATSSSQANKLLYYNVIYDKVRNGYSFLVKEQESGNYSSNSLTLETGSTVNFGINDNSLVLNTKLSKSPIISTNAYNNSVCSNFETNLSISDCTTGMFKWTTTTGDENVNPLTIKPITTLANEQIVYRANCFDKYCINENSNAITLTVYNGLPDLTLSSDKSVMCSYETAILTVDSTCAGKINWITPENISFVEDNVYSKTVNYPTIIATENKTYQVQCNLSGCVSNQTNIATVNIGIKKAPAKPLLSSDDTNNKVCSGNDIIISGNCNATDTFKWTAGLTDADPNPFTLTTDVNNPQNKVYNYKATCTNDGCSTENDIIINEYAIPKPTQFFAIRNPIEIDGLAEIVALGCPQGSDIWSNGKNGIWNGWNGSVMTENINENKTYSVRCVVNGCSSLPTAPITIYVASCEEAYPSPKAFGSINNVSEVLPNGEVKLYASGCTNYEWSNGTESGNNDGTSSIIAVYPSETTTYKVRCKKDNSCKSAWSGDLTIRVKSCEEGVPSPSAFGTIDNVNDVIPNASVGLYAFGCSNQYEWSNNEISRGSAGTSITVKPSETTKYKVRCKVDDGCKSAWSGDIEVRVKSCEEGVPSPSAFGTIDNVNDVIPNTSVGLYAFGCSNEYEWSNNEISRGSAGTSITVKPSETTTYKVRCKVDDGCKSAWSGNIEVRVKSCVEGVPSPSAFGTIDNVNDVIPNTSVGLYAFGCSNEYEWSNNEISRGSAGTSIIVKPSETTTYKVRCKVDDGCKSAWSGNIEVRVKSCEQGVSAPSAIGTLGNQNDVLPNTSVGLYASGCSNQYEWEHGVTSGKNDGANTNITVNPSETTKYRVRCKVDGGCKSAWSGDIEVRVNGGTPPPNTTPIWTYQNDICREQIAYKVEKDTNPNSSSYKITREVVGGTRDCSPCVGKSTAAPSISADKTNLTSNTDKARLTATGCSGTVAWSNGENGTQIEVSVAATYTATCTVGGCMSANSNEIAITKDGCTIPTAPSISADKTNLLSDTDKARLTATGCSGTVAWSNGGNGTQIDVSVATKYTAKCSVSGCVSANSNEIAIEGCSTPAAPSISTDKTNLTSDTDSATLKASGCSGSISWSNGSNGTQISVSTAGKYTATCNVSGCVSGNSNEITITKEGCTTPNKPTISISNVSANEITVSASCSSGSTLTWTAPTGFSGGSYTPNANTTFKAKCVKTGGCESEEDSKVATINVTDCSMNPSITAPSCALNGNEVTISGSCGNSKAIISWLIGRDKNTALTTHDAIIKDSRTNDYFIIDCAIPDCPSQSAEHLLKRNTKPTPIITSIVDFKAKNDIIFVNISTVPNFQNEISGDIKQGKYYKYIAEQNSGQYTYSLRHTSECGNSDLATMSIVVYNSYKVYIEGKHDMLGNCKNTSAQGYLYVSDIAMPNGTYFYTDPQLTKRYDFKVTGRFCIRVFNNKVEQEGGRDVSAYNTTYRTINEDKVISQ